MDNIRFIEECRRFVADYANAHRTERDNTKITQDDVFVVWSCKTLQNNKALLATTQRDGMCYEMTYNGDKDEMYFDAYRKWDNIVYKPGDVVEISV